jgi:hypothetical protein
MVRAPVTVRAPAERRDLLEGWRGHGLVGRLYGGGRAEARQEAHAAHSLVNFRRQPFREATDTFSTRRGERAWACAADQASAFRQGIEAGPGAVRDRVVGG